ncbi:CHypothetical proteinSP N terminal [Nesidiocoris tenuis]|uniref:TOG domain-containing protein n=1 Tax=Nesidiocoris tenuis TaxID=355587 RepID=A0ABN7B0Q3_9HEMI|nr:CHypothetical proteinSP N terminal [Nesidiocoris tenuis]
MAKVNLDHYFSNLVKASSIEEKIKLGNDFFEYMQSGASFECQNIGEVVDGILPFIQSSDVELSNMGLDVMTELVRRMERIYRPYIPSVLACVIDRLGDSKETVRERCLTFLTRLVDVGLLTPQELIDHLAPAFSNRSSNLKNGAMKCLIFTLDRYGGHCLEPSRIVPLFAGLLGDPDVDVRKKTLVNLTQVYTRVGDGFRSELAKSLPPSQILIVMEEFDKVKLGSELSVSAMSSVGGSLNIDECVISDASTVNATNASTGCIQSDEPSALLEIRAADKGRSKLNWSEESGEPSTTSARARKRSKKSSIKTFKLPGAFQKSMKRNISVDFSLNSDSSCDGLTGCNMEMTLAPAAAEPIFKSRSTKRRSIDFSCGVDSSVASAHSSNDGTVMLDGDHTKSYVNIFKKKTPNRKNIDFSLQFSQSTDSSTVSERSDNSTREPPIENISQSASFQNTNRKSCNATFIVEGKTVRPDVEGPDSPSQKSDFGDSGGIVQPSTLDREENNLKTRQNQKTDRLEMASFEEQTLKNSIPNPNNSSPPHINFRPEVAPPFQHTECGTAIPKDTMGMPDLEQVPQSPSQGNRNCSSIGTISSLTPPGNVSACNSIEVLQEPKERLPDKTTGAPSSPGADKMDHPNETSLSRKRKSLLNAISQLKGAEEPQDVDDQPGSDFLENGVETTLGIPQTEGTTVGDTIAAVNRPSHTLDPQEEKSDCLEICSLNKKPCTDSDASAGNLPQLNPGKVALVKPAQQKIRDISLDISLTSDSSGEGLNSCNMELTLAPALAQPIFKSRSIKRQSVAFPLGDDSSVASGHSTNDGTNMLDADRTKSYVNFFKKRKLEKKIDISLQLTQSSDSLNVSEQISSTRAFTAEDIPESVSFQNCYLKPPNATFTVEEISHKSMELSLDAPSIDVQPLDLPANTIEFGLNAHDPKSNNLDVGSTVEKSRIDSSSSKAVNGSPSLLMQSPAAEVSAAMQHSPAREKAIDKPSELTLSKSLSAQSTAKVDDTSQTQIVVPPIEQEQALQLPCQETIVDSLNSKVPNEGPRPCTSIATEDALTICSGVQLPELTISSSLNAQSTARADDAPPTQIMVLPKEQELQLPSQPNKTDGFNEKLSIEGQNSSNSIAMEGELRIGPEAQASEPVLRKSLRAQCTAQVDGTPQTQIGIPPKEQALQLPCQLTKTDGFNEKLSTGGQNPSNSIAMEGELRIGPEAQASEPVLRKSLRPQCTAKVDGTPQTNMVVQTAPRASIRKFVTFRESSPEILRYSAGSEPSNSGNADGNEAACMQMTTELSMIPGEKIRQTRSGGCYSSTPFPKKKTPAEETVDEEPHVFVVPGIPASQIPRPSEGSSSSETMNSDYTLNISAIPKDAALPKSTKLFTSTPKPLSRREIKKRNKVEKDKSIRSENAVNHSVQTSRVLRSSASRVSSEQEKSESQSGRAITDLTNLTSYGEAEGKRRSNRSKSLADARMEKSENSQPSLSPVEPIPIADETVLCPQVGIEARAATSSHNVRTATSKGSSLTVSQIDRRSASKRLFTPTSSKSGRSSSQKSINSLAVAGPSTNRFDLSNDDLRLADDLDTGASLGNDDGVLSYAPTESLQGASVSEVDREEVDRSQFSSGRSTCSSLSDSSFDCDNPQRWYRKHGSDFKTRSARKRQKMEVAVPELRKMRPIKSHGSEFESWMRKKRKMFKPAKWVTKDLYVYLEKRLEPSYGLDKRLKAEEVVLAMADSYNRVQAGHIGGALDQLKATMRDLEICNIYVTFYAFLQKFMPYDYLKHVLEMPSRLYKYTPGALHQSCYDLI